MNWTVDQQKIIDSRNCNLLVSAAAGSGKTAVLVERIIQMISDKDNPLNIDELLVVTFTKAAAAQMRDKIAAAIENMLDEDPTNEHFIRQLNYIHKANILTIDSFCYQVVKEHFHVLGIDPGIRVGEAGEIGVLRADVLESVMEAFYETNTDFVQFSEAFSADKRDDNIEDYILKVYDICSSYPRPSEWIRQAKESLQVESEESFLKLPFVTHYFDEIHGSAQGIKEKMMKALDMTRVTDGPLHLEKTILSDIVVVDSIITAKTYSQFYDIKQQSFERLAPPKKGAEFDKDIAEQIKKLREAYKKQINALLELFVLPIEQVIEQFGKQRAMLTALLDIADSFREEFLKAKLQKGILEFSDVEHFALQILCKEYDENGVPVPSDIGREMSEDFREILIDEYQDSNFLQEAILQSVSRLHQGEYNIFMVGDVKQSIYSFRMARPDLFMEKYHTYDVKETAKCRKLLLKNNFRSRANVLECINYIFYQIMGQDLGGIEYTEEEALVPGREFPDGPNDSVELLLGESKDFEFLALQEGEDSSDLIKVMSGEKEENLDDNLEDIGKKELEATMVAQRISRLLGREGSEPYKVVDEHTGELRDVRLSDMVILFRAPTSFQQIFAEVLASYDIPVKVQNESGYFDTTEIQLVLSLLKVIDNPHIDIELAGVLRSYFAGFTNNDLAFLTLVRRYLKEQSQWNLHLYQVIEFLSGYATYKRDGLIDEKSDSDWIKKLRSSWEQVLQKQLADCQEQWVNDIYDKCISFCSLIKHFQQLMSYRTVDQILEEIYYGTEYYYYVNAMPEGNQRVRNLELFYQEAKQFSSSAFKSVFDFLSYINKLTKRSISLGGDPAPDSSEDVVRIMSIHKSKGLEFPVVFLSGIGKNFNLMDTKTPLILHSDYYIGAKYVNTDKRCGNDTFARQAFASLMVTESIAEELRILYVGLTRAKEKLIMTGVTPDITALIKKYSMITDRQQQRLSYAWVHTANNYLDLVVMSFIRNGAFHAAMEGVKSRIDNKTGELLSAKYDLGIQMTEPDICLEVAIYDYQYLAGRHLQSSVEKQLDRIGNLEVLANAPTEYTDELQHRLSWKYADEVMSLQKSKMSVTEIKRMYEKDYDVVSEEGFASGAGVIENELLEDEFINNEHYDNAIAIPVLPEDTSSVDTIADKKQSFLERYIPPMPKFVSGNKPFDAAEKGTWMHKMMELLPNAEAETKEEVEKALVTMWESGRLPEETRSFITVDKVYTFVSSKLGIRMREAAKQGNLYKEKQFVVGVPVERIAGVSKEEVQAGSTPVVVQGIIDAYFRERDELILLDYKTDKIKDGQEQLLVERYRTQLQYYKDTLEQLTGLTVSETYIYSFALGKEIRM